MRDWLRANYTLDENPGMGAQGLYYDLHLMTTALNASEVESMELADARRADWRRVVGLRLLNLHPRDGSRSNDDNRWWEKDPNHVTAYAVLSLGMICWGL